MAASHVLSCDHELRGKRARLERGRAQATRGGVHLASRGGRRKDRQVTSGAAALSVETKQALLRSLSVELSVELAPYEDADPYPPGAQDYNAAFLVTWFPEDVVTLARDAIILRGLAVEAGAELTGEEIRLPVGSGHFLLIDLHEPEVLDSLDAREADLETLGSAVLAGRSDETEMMAPGLVQRFDAFGSYAILVNHVEISSAWRGSGAGLAATAAVLQGMRRGCAFAALYPMEPGLRETSARSAARAGLQRYWGRLGFADWTDNVMVLSLTRTDLDQACDRWGFRSEF